MAAFPKPIWGAHDLTVPQFVTAYEYPVLAVMAKMAKPESPVHLDPIKIAVLEPF